MAVAFDVVQPGSSGFTTSSASGSWTHTVTAGLSNVGLLVFVDSVMGLDTGATTSCTLPPGLNLDAVEQALTEELAALARDHEEVSAEAQPTIRFERFDGTSVVCTVRLRARSHSDVPQLTHLLVKQVNERLLAGLTPRGDAAAR